MRQRTLVAITAALGVGAAMALAALLYFVILPMVLGFFTGCPSC